MFLRFVFLLITRVVRGAVAAGADPGARRWRRTRRGTDVPSPVGAEEAIGYLRVHGVTRTWDRAAGTLRIAVVVAM